MKLNAKVFMASSTLLLFSVANAATIPNTDDPTTFLGPTLRAGFTTNIGNEAAFSIAGEAAPKMGRLSGTVGWKIDDHQRFKVTAEYLWQHIMFGFFPGNVKGWGQQETAGVVYQYDIVKTAFQPQVGFNAYVFYSPNKIYGIEQGTFLNSQGNTQNYIVNRRATGGRGYGASPIVTLTPWQGGKLHGEINYDNVGYDNDYPVNQNARGFGITAGLHQMVSKTVDVGVGAAIRQPFNSYAANMTWTCVPFLKNWTLELFGEYTVGKHTLPDTYNVGLAANFYLDKRMEIVPSPNPKEKFSTQPVVDNLLVFTASPAVYMPVVLSVADEQVEIF